MTILKQQYTNNVMVIKNSSITTLLKQHYYINSIIAIL